MQLIFGLGIFGGVPSFMETNYVAIKNENSSRTQTPRLFPAPPLSTQRGIFGAEFSCQLVWIKKGVRGVMMWGLSNGRVLKYFETLNGRV